MADAERDPLELLKSLWGGMGFTLPGMVTPTLDEDELAKRIADLKAVEGWLKMNLNMLQTSIQGMEIQRATLSALQTMSQYPGSAEAQPNPNPFAAFAAFADPAANAPGWPWSFGQPAAATAPPEPVKTAPGKKKK